MDRLIADRGLSGRVKIHDPVPFPRLLGIAKECDVFLCCHVQGDPSCTYLESMGCGLPIVGYSNAMWRAMQTESRAGVATALGDPGGIAEALAGMLSTAGEIDALSLRARAFAAEHTFEKEFARRTDSLNQLLLSLDRNSAPQPSA